MCGIFGYVTTNPAAISPGCLETALDALRHRGPDDEGIFTSTVASVHCGLAHTRLSIIDLSPLGHQPMTTEDGRYTIVYNGEVYNFRDIRQDLESRGEVFMSNCDTEVVLKAYAQWGRACVQRFRGMFAFAIWDAQEGSLFMARDRLGIKPLYYSITPDRLAFASEVRTFLATGLAERKLSRAGLMSYFAFGSVTENETILNGVSSLPPGSTLEYRQQTMTISRYWEIPFGANGIESFSDAVAGLNPLLREAVSLRLIADVPVGVFLSGGIDSSVVVALAAEASNAPVHTFTVTFNEAAYDEARYAAEVASRFGCRHHQIHLPALRAISEIDDALKALDQPSADGVNTYFVSKAAKEAGLTVALSGLGGDEVFAGYDNFRSFNRFIKSARTARFASALPVKDLLALMPFNGVSNRTRKLASLLTTKGDPGAAYAVLRGMFMPEQQRALIAPEFLADRHDGDTYLPGELAQMFARGQVDPINLYSVLELTNYLRHTLLRDTDAMSMAHGLEVRVPLIDHRLVEQAARIPGSLKLKPGENKPLLTAVVPNLPSNVTARRKMGFTLPFDTWLRGPLKPWIDNLLAPESLKRLSFLNPSGVEQLWKSFLKGEHYTSYSRVWCIAALVGWCHENGVEA